MDSPAGILHFAEFVDIAHGAVVKGIDHLTCGLDFLYKSGEILTVLGTDVFLRTCQFCFFKTGDRISRTGTAVEICEYDFVRFHGKPPEWEIPNMYNLMISRKALKRKNGKNMRAMWDICSYPKKSTPETGGGKWYYLNPVENSTGRMKSFRR